MTGRFNLPNDNDCDGVIERANDIEIKLWRRKPNEHDDRPAGISGSFTITGDFGEVEDSVTTDELSFIRKLLERFGK